MAHNLYRGSMVFTGATPWHGLGTQLPGLSTWEEIKPLLPFYEAKERQIYASGIPYPLPDVKAIVRGDDGQYLGTVGKDYGVVQFEELARAVVTACGGQAVFNTAGLLGPNGARAWLQGTLKSGPIKVHGDESPIEPYFYAAAGHDGTFAVHMGNSATRIVCQNTLGVARGEDRSKWSIRHTSNAGDRVKSAAESFRNLVESVKQLEQLADALARCKVTQAQSIEVVESVFPVADGAGDKATENAEGRRAEVLRLAEHGTGIGLEMCGTAWALFQGFTEWADHHKEMRTPTQAKRLESNLWGPSAAVKTDALAEILRVTNISQSAT